MPVPNIFAGQGGPIPLSRLDANFAAILASSQGNTQFTQFFASATTLVAFNLSDNQLTIGDDGTTAIKDAGAIRGFCTLTSTTKQGFPRGVESQTSIPLGATFHGAFGIEVGLHSQVSGNASSTVPISIGVYCASSHTGWLPSGVRNDCGVFIGGEDGWVNPLLCVDTDFATVLFQVTQTGGIFAKGTVTLNMADDSSGANLQVNGFARFGAGTAITAGGSANTSIRIGPTGSAVGVFVGSGAPTLSASQGSLYLRTDGATTTTRAYSCLGGTSWTALIAAS